MPTNRLDDMLGKAEERERKSYTPKGFDLPDGDYVVRVFSASLEVQTVTAPGGDKEDVDAIFYTLIVTGGDYDGSDMETNRYLRTQGNIDWAMTELVTMGVCVTVPKKEMELREALAKAEETFQRIRKVTKKDKDGVDRMNVYFNERVEAPAGHQVQPPREKRLSMDEAFGKTESAKPRRQPAF